MAQFKTIIEIKGNLQEALRSQADAISDHLRSAVQEVSASLQEDLRSQMRAAGLGAKLANAWRRDVYPKTNKQTFHPSSLVYTKSVVLPDVFDQGATILPRRGRYLVVPLPEAIKRNLHTTRVSRKGGNAPGSNPRKASMLAEAAKVLGAKVVSARPRERGPTGPRKTTFKPYILLTPTRAGSGKLLALYHASRGSKAVPLFVLIRQATIAKRIDIASAAERASARLAAAINQGA